LKEEHLDFDAGRRYSKSDTSDISNGNGGANQRWLVVDANDGWQWTPTMVGNGRQRWLAMDANDGWQNHVIARSIYSPVVLIGNQAPQ